MTLGITESQEKIFTAISKIVEFHIFRIIGKPKFQAKNRHTIISQKLFDIFVLLLCGKTDEIKICGEKLKKI